MKKFSLILLVLFVLLFSCSKGVDIDNVEDQPNFSGIVDEVNENSILVKVNEGEDEIQSSDLISVSLDVKLKDGITNFLVGDEVRVYYDGTILESYPAQVNQVYLIMLVTPVDED